MQPDELVALSIGQEPTDIEFIALVRIAISPNRAETLVKSSSAMETPSNQTHGSWDFYLDN
ncbi:MAG: hypothetical protein ABIU05_09005, partial [Nitrospirales bacterium]